MMILMNLQKCKDNERPKKPCSAFVLYFKSQLSQRGATQEFRDFQRQIADKWKTLTDTEKKPFVDAMIEQMKEYQKLMIVWEEKMIKLGNTDIVRHDAQLDPKLKATGKKTDIVQDDVRPERKQVKAPRMKVDIVKHGSKVRRAPRKKADNVHPDEQLEPKKTE